jgi:lipopolysaccharide/colanic/teichoic acid biosynthesis glycosyltransferase
MTPHVAAGRTAAGDPLAPRLAKRIVDYGIGIPAFLVSLPLTAALALLVRLSDRGPALFRQEREGLHGTTFPLLKLRTMFTDADARLDDHLADNPDRAAEWQKYFTLIDDPRVIPVVGRWLRRTSLDELPNLWNVVRGDLSLVGPRPLPLYELDTLDDDFRAVRRRVRPGLTGPWQVARGDHDALEHLERAYVEHWSILEDLRIILRTLPLLIRGKARP